MVAHNSDPNQVTRVVPPLGKWDIQVEIVSRDRPDMGEATVLGT